MGYTHYFYRKPQLDPELFVSWSDACQKLVNAWNANPGRKEDRIANQEYGKYGPTDEGTPIFTGELVSFNGVGENAHETFHVERTMRPRLSDDKEYVFDFCKTARKPYSSVVCACLIAMKHRFGDDVKISSDGNMGDWDWHSGKIFAASVLNIPELEYADFSEDDGKLAFFPERANASAGQLVVDTRVLLEEIKEIFENILDQERCVGVDVDEDTSDDGYAEASATCPCLACRVGRAQEQVVFKLAELEEEGD